MLPKGHPNKGRPDFHRNRISDIVYVRHVVDLLSSKSKKSTERFVLFAILGPGPPALARGSHEQLISSDMADMPSPASIKRRMKEGF